MTRPIFFAAFILILLHGALATAKGAPLAPSTESQGIEPVTTDPRKLAMEALRGASKESAAPVMHSDAVRKGGAGEESHRKQVRRIGPVDSSRLRETLRFIRPAAALHRAPATRLVVVPTIPAASLTPRRGPGAAASRAFEAPVRMRPTFGEPAAGALGRDRVADDVVERHPGSLAPAYRDPGTDLAIVSADVVHDGPARGRIRFVVSDLNRSLATPLGRPIHYVVSYASGGRLASGIFTLARRAGEEPRAEVMTLARVPASADEPHRSYRIEVDDDRALADVRRSNNAVTQTLGLQAWAGNPAAQPGDGLQGAWVDSEGPGWLRIRIRYALTISGPEQQERMFSLRFERQGAGLFLNYEIQCMNGRRLYDPLRENETLYLCLHDRGPTRIESRRIHITMSTARVNGLARQELILDHPKTWVRGAPAEGGRPSLPDLSGAMRGFTQGPSGLGVEASFAVSNVGDGFALGSTVSIELFFVRGPVFRQRFRVRQLRPGEEQVFTVSVPEYHASGVERRVRAPGLVALITVDEEEELIELNEATPRGASNLLAFRL